MKRTLTCTITTYEFASAPHISHILAPVAALLEIERRRRVRIVGILRPPLNSFHGRNLALSKSSSSSTSSSSGDTSISSFSSWPSIKMSFHCSSPLPSCIFTISPYIFVLSKNVLRHSVSPLKRSYFLKTSNRRGYRLIIDFSEFLILWSQIDFQIFFSVSRSQSARPASKSKVDRCLI